MKDSGDSEVEFLEASSVPLINSLRLNSEYSFSTGPNSGEAALLEDLPLGEEGDCPFSVVPLTFFPCAPLIPFTELSLVLFPLARLVLLPLTGLELLLP